MTIRDFGRAIARRRATGGVIFAVCMLAALGVSAVATPLYQATALFQVAQLDDLGRDPMAWSVSHGVRLRLNADILDTWIGREDVLQRIIERARPQRPITAVQLDHHLQVLPAGDGGIYAATVWAASPTDAQRLADATAEVVGARAADLLQRDRQALVDRFRRTLAGLKAMLTEQPGGAPPNRSADPADPAVVARVRRLAAANTYLMVLVQFTSLEDEYRTNPAEARMLEPAGRPLSPVTPSRALYLLFGIATGLVCGLAGMLIHEAWRGAEGSGPPHRHG